MEALMSTRSNNTTAAQIKAKSAALLSYLSNPVISDHRAEQLTQQYFDLQEQLRLAA
jgi:hypothetical protein